MVTPNTTFTPRLEYAPAGANLTPGSAAWARGSVLAYAAGPAVVLYDTEACATLTTLHTGATARVNCVALSPDRDRLAAGTADGRVLVWRLDGSAPPLSATVDGGPPVVALAWHDATLAAAADDGVAVWQVEGAGLVPRPSIALGRARRAHGAALARGAAGALVLALGHVDGSASVWLASGDDPAFECAAVAAGHGDWVRGVALKPVTPPDAASSSFLLATASNDGTARVWTLDSPPRAGAAPPPPGSEAALDASITALASAPRAARAALTPAAVLSGHGDWVTAVAWAPADAPLLLTTSADRSVRLWAPAGGIVAATAAAAAVWLDVAAVGDAGVAAVGYVSGSFSDDGDALAAVGPGGAVHVWRQKTGDGARWTADPAAGGHAGAVVDVAWTGPHGTALLTASADMTARLHARVEGAGPGDRNPSWCEVGRPQVHGHPLAAVAPLPGTLVYASASEEKVVRVFAAPAAVVESLALAGGADAAAAAAAGAAAPAGAYGAAVPALGLSNKALHGPGVVDEGVAGGDAGQYGGTADSLPPAVPAAFAGRPPHAHLAAATLWPETAKLYGHGAEVAALAAAPAGDVVASAADARTPRHAAVRLWSPAAGWAPACPPIELHALTVTGLAWSGDGGRLLSVSRDRSWGVVDVARGDDGASPTSSSCTATPVAHRAAAHARALTAGAWTACGAGVVTAARDGRVRGWAVAVAAAGAPPAFELPPFDGAVTALAARPLDASNDTLLAVGTAAGGVQLWRVALSAPPVHLWSAPPCHAHAGAVHRLAFAPAAADGAWGDGRGRLAAGGGDGGVRVWAV